MHRRLSGAFQSVRLLPPQARTPKLAIWELVQNSRPHATPEQDFVWKQAVVSIWDGEQ